MMERDSPSPGNCGSSQEGCHVAGNAVQRGLNGGEIPKRCRDGGGQS